MNEIIGGALVFAGIGAFIAGLVILIIPLKKTFFNQRRKSFIFFGAWIACWVIASPLLPKVTEEPKPATAEKVPELSIRDATKCVKKVEQFNDVVNVDCYVNGAFSKSGYIKSASSEVRAIGQAVSKGAADASTSKYILITFFVGSTDRLGNPVVVPAFALTFPTDDLRRANYEYISSAKILNLANDISLQPISYDMVSNWCAENREAAAEFCARAAQ